MQSLNLSSTFTDCKLHSDLRTFGLNPTEWNLHRMQSIGYLIKNRFDQDFKMVGYLDKKAKEPRWKKLKVISF